MARHVASVVFGTISLGCIASKVRSIPHLSRKQAGICSGLCADVSFLDSFLDVGLIHGMAATTIVSVRRVSSFVACLTF